MKLKVSIIISFQYCVSKVGEKKIGVEVCVMCTKKKGGMRWGVGSWYDKVEVYHRYETLDVGCCGGA